MTMVAGEVIPDALPVPAPSRTRPFSRPGAPAAPPTPAPAAPGDPVTHLWLPDVLGEGYERLTLPLAADDEGPVMATLVRRVPEEGSDVVPDAGFDVLYVHGWSDYFFQTELADFWAARGARFFALDLRKYGRSLRAWQTPGFVSDLQTYDEDIDAALAAMAAPIPEAAARAGRAAQRIPAEPPASPRRLVIMGHSTGGLTMSLWVARNQERVSALVLNSPWLEFQTRQVGRVALAPLVTLGVHGFEVRPGWLGAVLAGHAQVAHGLKISVPILTLLSTRSTLLPRWTPEMMHTDTALDVVGIARRATDLGATCTIARIDGALHDVVLSAPEVRAVAYQQIAAWLRAYVPVGAADSAGPDAPVGSAAGREG